MHALWKELRPLVRHLAAFSFVINLLFLVPAIFTLQVFDRVIPSNSGDTLLVLLAGAAVALLILLALDYVRNRLQNVVGNLVEERLSPPVVAAIVARAARNPLAVRSASVADVAMLKNVFSANGLIALFDAPWVVIYVLVIWAFHPVLGLGAAGFALLMLAIAWLNDRVGRRPLEDLQRETRRAAQYVETSVRNAEVLQALGMTERLLDRWQAMQRRLLPLQTEASRGAVAFSATTRFLRQTIQVAMLGLGAWLVLSQQASPGVMIATTILLGRAVQPVEQLVGNWRALVDARAALARLNELAAELEKQEPRVRLPRPNGQLAVAGVSYRSDGGERLLVSNISFELEPGEALAVIGPSAAGKSTLARMLTGIWAPTVGSVRLDGVELASWPRDELGPWIGYVPQDVELFDGSVADNIARLAEVDSEAVIAAARRANAHELILSLPEGYETQVGEHGCRLSPGQRQRVALARALYGDPRLVVLDEPNSNLDGEGEVALAQALGTLHGEGVTTVVVTHRPSLIAHVDKILVLEAGQIRRYGPASELMKIMRPAPVAGEERVA